MVSFYHIMPEGGSNPLSWRLITVPNTSIWTGARFNFGGALANVRSKSYSWEFRRRDAHTQARLGEKLFKTSEPHNSAYLLHTSPILLIISNLRLKNSSTRFYITRARAHKDGGCCYGLAVMVVKVKERVEEQQQKLLELQRQEAPLGERPGEAYNKELGNVQTREVMCLVRWNMANSIPQLWKKGA